MQAHDVGLLQQLVDVDHRHLGVRARRAVPGDDLEADAAGDARHLAADAAQTHHAQRLAAQLHALHRPPAAALHQGMHGADVAGRGEHQAHGMLGHRRVAIARDGRDLDADLRGRREVDEARRARAEEHDVLQPGAALQRVLVEVGRVVDDGVVALDQLGNGIGRHRPHVDLDRDVGRAVDLLPDAVDVGCRIDEQSLGHHSLNLVVRPRGPAAPGCARPSSGPAPATARAPGYGRCRCARHSGRSARPPRPASR